MIEPPITPLEFAFVIQDPCGDSAVALAREVLTLVCDREEDATVTALAAELRTLNAKYPRSLRGYLNAPPMCLAVLVASDVKGALDRLVGANERLRKGQPQDRIMAVVVSDRINKAHESLAAVLDYLNAKGPDL